MSPDPENARYLQTTEAVRERAARMLELGLSGRLDHFSVHLDRLPLTAHRVVEVTRSTYPTLDIPYHGRLGHFGAGGIDRVDSSGLTDPRSIVDLVVVSVLLDAGAGTKWRYREPGTGLVLSRSEGLAVASFHLFESGVVSGLAGSLRSVTIDALARGFQVSESNPLAGLSGRLGLLHNLASALDAHPETFGQPARVGSIVDYLASLASTGRIEAHRVLEAILDGLGGIWPGGGDVFSHRLVGRVPFHKLSQWLTYSLIEPLERSGLEVTELDALTGLAEYRNGGLFVDTGVLRAKHEAVLGEEHDPSSELVVEWRALTVALIDRVAELVREELSLDAASLPLAKILEGGTWRAGRAIAAELREDGAPPIRVRSAGNLF